LPFVVSDHYYKQKINYFLGLSLNNSCIWSIIRFIFNFEIENFVNLVSW
jgi:hypothetical protein